MIRSLAALGALFMACLPLFGRQAFRVHPYLQNPSGDAMTVRWLANERTESSLELRGPDGSTTTHGPEILEAGALVYDPWEVEQYFGGTSSAAPFLYSARVDGLSPGTTYAYSVTLGETRFESTFRTAPDSRVPVRFIVYGDPETEPESVGNHGRWPSPDGLDADRRYLLDQDEGYRHNLRLMRDRSPDLVLIAGDLVRIGQEQRDWDAFWTYHVAVNPDESIASSVPLLAVPGNHEYLSPHGPDPQRTYDQPQAERSIGRYLTYFEFPENGAPFPEQRGRYWRTDYGPVTLIGLDVNNQSPHGSSKDTNLYMRSADDGEDGWAPDFAPGSAQYEWLESQLESAQRTGLFTFVLLHHCPYSSSLHGLPPGFGDGFDPLSGLPVQVLLPLFVRYGVDAVLSGHGEIFERSSYEGMELDPSTGSPNPHTVLVYDVGVGGDDLRAPAPGVANANRRFLAAYDAPELWEGERLVDGGAHYGHLEIDVAPADDGTWEAVLEPVYAFPVFDASSGDLLRVERRVYDDVQVLRSAEGPVNQFSAGRPIPEPSPPFASPNPTSDQLRLRLPESGEAWTVRVFDGLGRVVYRGRVIDTGRAYIDTALWTAGIYFIELGASGRRFSDTVLVVR